jgi:multimeric flavodoxin WrbA
MAFPLVGWNRVKRVLAISGSFRAEKSDTSKILGPFLKGMEDAGASVELLYTRKLRISQCIGDFECWYGRPGECIIKDDMQKLYPRIKKADILVLAIPVYIPLPGEMQNLLNRLCPLLEPVLVKKGRRTRAKVHDDVNIRQVVLVSTCGWWEKENMDTVLRIAKELAADMSVEFAGAVLRPHAQYLGRDKEKTRAVLEAARRAGSELVKNGKMPKALLERVSRPLIPEAEMRRRSNEGYARVKAGQRD